MQGDKKCECNKGEEECCCGCKMEKPEYFKCEISRCAFLKTMCKEEAKRYCCIRRTLKGLGMGLPIWTPEMCKDKKELESLCCGGECKGKECDAKCCKEKAEECVKNPDCLTKCLLECKLVPQYIKDCPLLLCMFKMEVIKQHAKQCFRLSCMKKGCCCCCCCEKKECCKDKCCKEECK